MVALRLSGVTGGAKLFLIFGTAGTLGGFGVTTLLLPRSSEVGIAECSLSSASGSVNSKRRSAALCACSARARSASSTGIASEGFPGESERAFDTVFGVERPDDGENDGGWEVRLEAGGYNLYGVEKDITFADSSISESLSSGIGIVVAKRRESSSSRSGITMDCLTGMVAEKGGA